MFTVSERGGNSIAIEFTLIEAAKLNKVDSHAWLTQGLNRIGEFKIRQFSVMVGEVLKG